MRYISKLNQFELNTNDSVELLLFNGVKFVDLVFEPFNTLTAKLCGRIMREKIVKRFISQKADYFH